MKTVSVPSRLWYENKDRSLTFPDRWEVDNLTSPGFEKPGLSPEEIREKVVNPIAGPSLAELATGRKQAVIVFDDMTRPTPGEGHRARMFSSSPPPGRHEKRPDPVHLGPGRPTGHTT